MKMARHYFVERQKIRWALPVRSRHRAWGAARRQAARSPGRAGAVRQALLVPSGGNVDGRSGDQVLLAPPFIVTGPEVETIVEMLALATDDALIEIGAA